MEQTFEDCGEDFTPLLLATELEELGALQRAQQCEEIFINISYHFGLCGSGFVANGPRDFYVGDTMHNLVFEDIAEFVAWERQRALGNRKLDDVSELCGGACDTGYLLVRRGFQHGDNFDIVAGFNMRSTQDVDYLWQYLEQCRPRIMLISTPCTGMKGFVALNRVINPLRTTAVET